MDKNIKYILNTFKNYVEMSLNAADFICDLSNSEINKKGYFTLVLSGGKTPEKLYSILAKSSIKWDKTRLFWGDERFVPHNHSESNYKMVREVLLSKIDIPQKNVFPIPTENLTPQESAKNYESTLRLFFKEMNNFDYSFDCILLGIGEDGHTASLFPGSPVLNEKKHWVKDVIAPENYTIRQRITLTLPIINRTNSIMFLVSGDKKRPVVEAMLKDSFADTKYPAQLVNSAGKMYVFTDIKLYN